MRSHEDGWGKVFDNLERTLEAARERQPASSRGGDQSHLAW